MESTNTFSTNLYFQWDANVFPLFGKSKQTKVPSHLNSATMIDEDPKIGTVWEKILTLKEFCQQTTL